MSIVNGRCATRLGGRRTESPSPTQKFEAPAVVGVPLTVPPLRQRQDPAASDPDRSTKRVRRAAVAALELETVRRADGPAGRIDAVVEAERQGDRHRDRRNDRQTDENSGETYRTHRDSPLGLPPPAGHGSRPFRAGRVVCQRRLMRRSARATRRRRPACRDPSRSTVAVMRSWLPARDSATLVDAEPAADPASARHRGREPDAIDAVVDRHPPVGGNTS